MRSATLLIAYVLVLICEDYHLFSDSMLAWLISEFDNVIHHQMICTKFNIQGMMRNPSDSYQQYGRGSLAVNLPVYSALRKSQVV